MLYGLMVKQTAIESTCGEEGRGRSPHAIGLSSVVIVGGARPALTGAEGESS